MKRSFKIILAVLLLLIIIRIALPFIIEKYVNKTLEEMPGYSGHVEDVDLHLYRGAYAIENLVLDIEDGENKTVPFLEIREIDLSVEWKALFKGSIVGEVHLISPKLNFVAQNFATESDTSTTLEEKEHWTKTLKDLMPLTINRFEIIDGKVSYLDYASEPAVDIYMNNLQMVATNLSNTENSTEELPSTIKVTGNTIGGGNINTTVEANVLKEIPDFDMDFKLIGVDLKSLNEFLKAYGKFDVERGQFDLFSEVKLIDGELTGYIKPFFDNLKVLNWEKDKEEDGFFRALWEGVVGLVSEGVENQPRDEVATQVPIKGNVNQPETDVWTTIINVLKNAFIEAFNKGLENTVKHEE